MADSVAVSLPRNGVMAVQDLRDSGGMATAVSDEAILEAMKLLGRTTGIFGEPAGVVALAALVQLLEQKKIASSERVVFMVTGSGLKDIDSALEGVSMPESLPVSLEAVTSRVHR